MHIILYNYSNLIFQVICLYSASPQTLELFAAGLFTLSLDLGNFYNMRVWIVSRAMPTFIYMQAMIQRQIAGMSAPAQPSDKEKSKPRNNNQTKPPTQYPYNKVIVIFGVAIFCVTVYLVWNVGVALVMEGDDDDDYVKRFGDPFLDFEYGDREELSWEYNKEEKRYELVREEIWTDDEVSSDDEPTQTQPN